MAGPSSLVVIVNADVTFTATLNSTGGTNYYIPVTYHWDFGNGDTRISTEPSVVYSYSVPGSWNITLTATNNVSSAQFVGMIHVSKGLLLHFMYRVCDNM